MVPGPPVSTDMGSAHVMLPLCLHSNLASGWTAAPLSRRCPTSGVKRVPQVSPSGPVVPLLGFAATGSREQCLC